MALPYSYKSRLTQERIRLLSLDLRGVKFEHDAGIYPRYSSDDAIVCSLEEFTWRDLPSYDALSYTWGNPFDVFASKRESDTSKEIYKQTLPIICDGKVLFIGANLHDALLSLRLTRRVKYVNLWELRNGRKMSKFIWIDAICINQSDIDERNAQVSIMDKIYRGTQNVFIWIGEDDVFRETAMAVLKRLTTVPFSNARNFGTVRSLANIDYSKIGLENISQEDWCCVYAFLARTWFKRLWIVQEVAVAPYAIFMAGIYLIPWRTVAASGQFLASSRWYYGMSFAAGLAMEAINIGEDQSNYKRPNISMYQMSLEPEFKEIQYETNCSLPEVLIGISHVRNGFRDEDGIFKVDLFTDGQLLDLLRQFRDQKCSDPRDRVFAMYGILKEQLRVSRRQRHVPSVDYRKNVAKLYLEAAWTILLHRQDLRLLCHVGNPTPDSDIPSWVPDWRVPSMKRVLESPEPASEQFPCAALNMKWQTPVDLDNSPLLKVYGKYIDSVDLTVRYDPGDRSEQLRLLRGILEKMPRLFMFEPRRETMSYFKPDSSDDNNRDKHGDSVLRLPVIGDKTLYQTRFEALWRTILLDTWNPIRAPSMIHPAPEEAGLALVQHLVLQGPSEATDGDQDSLDTLQSDNEQCLWMMKDEMTCALIIKECYSHENADYPSLKDETFPACWLFVFDHMEDILENFSKNLHVPTVDTCREHLDAVFTQDKKVLFTTAIGLPSVGSNLTTKGDEIWILAGCQVPCILRKQSDGGYQFIGVAYVHGIMNGEAMISVDESTLDEIILL